MFGFHIAEPNEALIVSGKRGKGDGTAEAQQYKIIASGDRVFVWPVLQSARSLALDLNRAIVPVNCVTTQGIPVRIQGVVAFKVGSDNASIANAVQRFLHKPDTMEERVHEIFAGHIRGIVGSLKVEELIRERDKLTSEALASTSADMEKMGLVIDTLQIAEIDDPSGYIENLSQPDIARVKMESRIAQASRDREASEREAENSALVAAAQRDSAIKQAEARAQVDKAQAEAAQAGPLAEAEAAKAVVSRQTEVADLEAARAEKQLNTQVRKPADAEAYAVAKRAEGERDAAFLRADADAQTTQKTGTAEAEIQKARGLADADVIRAKGEAEGSALKARAEGLAAESEAVIAQSVADKLPDIVRAAASAFDNVGQFTVLNGTEGVTEALTSLMATGGKALQVVRDELARNGTGQPDGARKQPVASAQAPGRIEG